MIVEIVDAIYQQVLRVGLDAKVRGELTAAVTILGLTGEMSKRVYRMRQR